MSSPLIYCQILQITQYKNGLNVESHRSRLLSSISGDSKSNPIKIRAAFDAINPTQGADLIFSYFLFHAAAANSHISPCMGLEERM